MPIASASSGMVMPGRARTSSSACTERVPEPLGGRGRPPPLDALALRRAGPARAGGAAAAARLVRHPGERALGRLEALILVRPAA